MCIYTASIYKMYLIHTYVYVCNMYVICTAYIYIYIHIYVYTHTHLSHFIIHIYIYIYISIQKVPPKTSDRQGLIKGVLPPRRHSRANLTSKGSPNRRSRAHLTSKGSQNRHSRANLTSKEPKLPFQSQLSPDISSQTLTL